MRVPRTTLKILAAATWYTGGGVLLYKGAGYLLGAASSGPTWPALLAGVLGSGAGVLRGRTMFLKACRRNLRRIDGLARPRAWQFFRPAFFAALAVMVAAGAALAWIAGTGYWGAVVVGGLELVIALGLLTSSVAFWRRDRADAPAGAADGTEARDAA
ncbi:MAG: hypothetical protein GWM90_24050 [Gemmatimonadetes bacterium]|nr:hypothetical protein [Gemmatimonadota bacterium]NIQ57798.1 hypothetical protein [Gemmatimonadota bacterium]NIU77953.1 hypothetical protein [Gammaproteobacteria bacterium]NIX47038.1 hypothetical protein [Gemmatimonadota bacterium]NIY11404.1 hypothetical protein [Gemmatimonadota bacterium]